MTDAEKVVKVKEILGKEEAEENQLAEQYLSGKMPGDEMGAKREKAKEEALKEIRQIVA
jgi:hypothetical protein